jgi:hypothetical protein
VRSRTPAGSFGLVGPRTYRPCKPPPVAQTAESLIDQLRRRRMRAGLTQRDLDHIAGWADGYTGKVEAPATAPGRRRPDPLSSFDLWLQALNVGIAIVPLGPIPANRRKPPPNPLQMELPFQDGG